MGHETFEIVGDPLLRPPASTATESDPRTDRRRSPAPTSSPASGSAPDPRPRPGSRPSPARAPVEAPANEFRPEIEGLRAIAVVAVLLYHAELGPFKGGYVGVDVFFVVSGFLITRLLANEVARTGTISLTRFWARRARRLLPASAVVIVATVLASAVMLDPLTQGFVFRSGVAASAFVANILFWTRGGYSQLTLPEPLLHFWSLAVEEQFYLFWPIILLGVARSRGHFRRLAVTVVVAVGVGSFVACVALTPSRQPFTFFWLPPRAWELLAGAGIALAGTGFIRSSARARAVAAWAGLIGIVVCTITFVDPQYGFPGAKAALPVVATVLVIVGAADNPAGPGRLLSMPVMLWVGKRSYAIYLWHFPFLILAGAKWGPLSAPERAGLLLVSIGVAAVSFVVLEDPVRRNAWLAAVPSRSLRLGGALVAAGILVSVVMLNRPTTLDAGTTSEAPTLLVADTSAENPDATPDTTVAPADGAVQSTDAPADTTPEEQVADTPYPANPDRLVQLASANAELLEQAVENDSVPSNLRPSLRAAYTDKPSIYDDGCILGGNQTSPGECVYGNVGSSKTVVLFGDSHAAQWFDAFEKAARDQGWRLVVMTKQACPTGDIPLQIAGQASECRTWRAKVLERLTERKPDLLVMASFRYKGSSAGVWKTGLDKTMADFRPVADQVVILGDTPTPKGDVPSCVAGHRRNLTKCNTSRGEAIKPNWLAVDADIAERYDARLVTTGDWLCAESDCPVVIGDVLVYRDESHLTTAASELLAPYVEAMVTPLIGS